MYCEDRLFSFLGIGTSVFNPIYEIINLTSSSNSSHENILPINGILSIATQRELPPRCSRIHFWLVKKKKGKEKTTLINLSLRQHKTHP